MASPVLYIENHHFPPRTDTATLLSYMRSLSPSHRLISIDLSECTSFSKEFFFFISNQYPYLNFVSAPNNIFFTNREIYVIATTGNGRTFPIEHFQVGHSAAHYLCECDSHDIIATTLLYNRILNSQTCYWDVEDRMGRTPLHVAAYNGNLYALYTILNSRQVIYYPNKPDAWGNTLLHAFFLGYKHSTKYPERYFPPEHQDTPFTFCLSLLIETLGCDVQLRNASGQTAFDIAESEHRSSNNPVLSEEFLEMLEYLTPPSEVESSMTEEPARSHRTPSPCPTNISYNAP